MGLGDDDGEAAEAEHLEPLEVLGRLGREVDTIRAVDPSRDRLDLLAQRLVQLVGGAEVVRVVAGLCHDLGERRGTSATVADVGGHGDPHAGGLGDLPDHGVLGGEVARERVDGHHRSHPERPHDLDVPPKVGSARLHRCRPLGEHLDREWPAGHDLVVPRVGLERAHRGDEHRRVRTKPRHPALDVEEPFGTHVGPEAGLGEQVVAGPDADPVRHDRGVARRDVAEGSGVHEDGGVLGRLQQVRLEGVLEDDRHRAGSLELLCGDGPSGGREPHHDPSQSLAQVPQGGGQGEDRHHLRGRGDVETGLSRHSVHARTQSFDDAAQRSVVDIQHPAPGDAARVDVELVAVVQVVVEHRGEQVVRRGDSVEVPGEVQVEGLHRQDLAAPGPGGPSLDPEGRPHGGLPQGQRGSSPEVAEPLRQAHCRRRLALAERRGRDRRDDDVPGGRPV